MSKRSKEKGLCYSPGCPEAALIQHGIMAGLLYHCGFQDNILGKF